MWQIDGEKVTCGTKGNVIKLRLVYNKKVEDIFVFSIFGVKKATQIDRFTSVRKIFEINTIYATLYKKP